MRATLITYIAALVFMPAVDAVWLTLTQATLYRPAIGELLATNFAPAPAVIFYVAYVFSLLALAVLPDWGALARRPAAAAARGAVFGFGAYATYDLTNQATLRQWATSLTLADMAWGTILSALTAFVAALLYARLTVITSEASARIR